MTDHVLPFRRRLRLETTHTAGEMRSLESDLRDAARLAASIPDSSEIDAQIARAIESARGEIALILAAWSRRP